MQRHHTAATYPKLPLADRLCDLAGVIEDLKDALGYLSVLEEQVAANTRNLIVWQGMSIATAIAYSRIFGRSKARSPIDRKLFETASEDLRTINQYLVACRDKHFAHSDNGYEENFLVVDLEFEDATPASVEAVRTDTRRLIPFTDNDVSLIKSLLLWVRSEVECMYEQQLKIVAMHVATLPLSQLASHQNERPFQFMGPNAHLHTRRR